MLQTPSHVQAGRPVIAQVLANLWKSLTWAWLDTVCQYRRSRIGPLWETINVVVMMLGLGVVSTSIFGGDLRGAIGYIGLGIIIWSAISSLIVEGSNTFVKNAGYVTSSNISIDLYVGRTVFRVFIVFCHHVLIYVIGLALGLVQPHWTIILALPGLFLLFLNGFWVVTLLGFICARFRDVDLIIRNLLQLAFFVTPVFWNFRHITSGREFIVDYNVLFYLIQLVRAPLLGEVPPLHYYVVVLATTSIGYGLAYLAYRRMRGELAFFVS